MSDAYLILGCPKSGKTTLARKLMTDAIASNGRALVVVDTGRNEVFDDMEHTSVIRQVYQLAWKEGRHIAYTPTSKDQFDKLCAVIYEAHFETKCGINFLLDELYNVVPSGRSVPESFQKCLRERRRVLAEAAVTSQFYRDGGRIVKGLVTKLVVHRMTSPEDREDLRTDWGFDPEVVKSLPSAEQAALAGDVTKASITMEVGF